MNQRQLTVHGSRSAAKTFKTLMMGCLGALWLLGYPRILAADQSDSASLAQAAPWLKLPVSARVAGMGGAFGAVGDDVSALDVNPAGLWGMDRPQFLLSHDAWFQGLTLEQVEFGLPLEGGGFAAGFGYANFGSIDAFTLGSNGLPVANGTVNPNALTARAGYGFSLFPKFNLGLMGGYVQQSLGGPTQGTFQAGAGLLLQDLLPKVSLGLSYLDGGGNFSGYSLPAQYKASLAFEPRIGKDHSFALAVDGDLPSNGSFLVMGGVEYWYKGFLALRAGEQYSGDLAANGTNGLSLGAGLNAGFLQFDYAFVNNGGLGNSSLFSLVYRIGGPEKRAAVRPRKPVGIGALVEVGDFKNGTLNQATFDLRPMARLGIKEWTFVITDKDGKVLRSYSGKGIPPAQLSWDGKDSSGNPVTGGIFARYKFDSVTAREEEVVSSETIFKIIEAPAKEAEILDSMKRNVQFGYDQAELSPSFAGQLNQLAAILIQEPRAHVLLVGYASPEGTEEYNRMLSEKRADVVQSHLLSKGVPKSQVDTLGKGSANPLLPNDTEEGRAQNRRVEIKVIMVSKTGS